jgi:hypothetical protein
MPILLTPLPQSPGRRADEAAIRHQLSGFELNGEQLAQGHDPIRTLWSFLAVSSVLLSTAADISSDARTMSSATTSIWFQFAQDVDV